MGVLLNLLLALVASLVAGVAAATLIAVQTEAREEFALVFTMLTFVAMMTTLAFALAQWRGDRQVRTARTGRLLALLPLAIGAGLATLSMSSAGSVQGVRQDIPIILGVVGPSLVVILVQWLVVGWRARRIAAQA